MAKEPVGVDGIELFGGGRDDRGCGAELGDEMKKHRAKFLAKEICAVAANRVGGIDRLTSALMSVFYDAPEEPEEQPPDVSHLRYNGLRVEIAEPKPRPVKPKELYLISDGIDVGYWGTSASYWILRTIPDEPLSVYGCDPKLVSLEGKLGPNGLPVEWVDFREPAEEELGINPITRHVVRYGYLGEFPCPAAPRIIVREVQPKAPRMWVCKEVSNGPFHRYIGESVFTDALRLLPNPDDPKVKAALVQAINNAPPEEVINAVIRAFLGLAK